VSEVDNVNTTVQSNADIGWPVHSATSVHQTENAHVVSRKDLNTVATRISHQQIAVVVQAHSLRTAKRSGRGSFVAVESHLDQLLLNVQNCNAMSVEVRDHQTTIRQVDEATRRVQILSHQTDVKGAFAQELTTRRKDLHAVVASIRNSNIVRRVARNAPWIVEHASMTAISTELEQKLALIVEDLHTVVVLVGNNDVIQRVGSDASRTIQITTRGSMLAEFHQELAVGTENLDTIVRAVRDENTAQLVTADTPRTRKLAIRCSLTAEREERQIVSHDVLIGALLQ